MYMQYYVFESIYNELLMVIPGYKVNTVLKCGWTPLMYAASSALPQIVKFLIDNGADPHSHKGKTKTQNQKITKKHFVV